MEKTVIYRERNQGRFGLSYWAVTNGEGRMVKRSQAEEMIAEGSAIWSSELKKQARGNCHCQVCGRQIEANTGKIALHGYTRKRGWQTASCGGAKYLPYEKSWLALPGVIASIESFIEAQQEYLAQLKGPQPPRGFEYLVTKVRVEREWVEVRATVLRGCAEYERRRKMEIASTEQQIKWAGEDLVKFIARLKEWKFNAEAK